MSTPRDPFDAFGVGFLGDQLGQQVGPTIVDHRGMIELPALAVLFDTVGGRPFHDLDDSSSSLQARLVMSALHRPAVTDRLIATGDVAMHDEGFGTTTVRIDTTEGTSVCTGLARNVRVGRTSRSRDEIGRLRLATEAEPPRAIDASLDGRAILDAIAHGDLPIGPIARLVNGSVVTGDGQTRFTVTTAEWMANMMGTMHGGIIGTVGALACSFGAQAHTEPGVDYQLLDFDMGFYRSPAVDGAPVHVDVAPVKVGRRIGSFEASMRADDDTLLARATADVRFLPR